VSTKYKVTIGNLNDETVSIKFDDLPEEYFYCVPYENDEWILIYGIDEDKLDTYVANEKVASLYKNSLVEYGLYTVAPDTANMYVDFDGVLGI